MSVVKMDFRKKPAAKTPGVYKMVAAGNRGEIVLYDIIGQDWWTGEGVTAKRFRDDLKALGKVAAIDLRINSEGGDVFDGRTIYSLLAEHPAQIVVHVDGLAASIASLIAMAGDEIRMADGSFMMIHNPWGMAVGDAGEMRKTADLLESVGGTLIDTYAARSNSQRSDVKKWMNEETWMTAQESLARGFATHVSDPIKAAASIKHPDRYQHLPAALDPRRARAQSAISRIKAASAK